MISMTPVPMIALANMSRLSSPASYDSDSHSVMADKISPISQCASIAFVEILNYS